jgi:hypothetical protein
MYKLALAFMFFAPIGSAMFLIGSTTVMWAWLIAAATAAAGTGQFLSGNWTIPRRPVLWLSPFLLFLLVALSSLLSSSYRSAALVKGLVQVAGITMMLVLVVTLTSLVSQRPAFAKAMIRIISLVLGWVSVIAVIQFVVNNTVRAPLINFEVLQIFGGVTGWRPPGVLGPFLRANSIEPEPAHLTTYLTMAAGLAFVRLGGLGRSKISPSVRAVMPAWAAVAIMGGFAVSVSIVGYAGILLAVAATSGIWLLVRRRLSSTRRISWRLAAVGGLVCALGAVAVPYVTGSSLAEKLSTISLIYDNPANPDSGEGGAPLSDSISLANNVGTNASALTLAVNTNVMLANLRERPLLGAGIGAHPVSYDDNVPEYAQMVENLVGMNKDDAASLAIRLLSETGLVGTAIFILGGLWGCWIGFRATRQAVMHGGNDTIAPVMAALTGSWLAVLLLHLVRFGVYYGPVFWASFGLVIIMSDRIAVAVTFAQVAPRRAAHVALPA